MNGAPVWPHVATLLTASLLAGIGGEIFVRAVVGTAARWRLSELLVAMTIAACATSAPELTVAIMASADGHSALALGDALGSNVTNILLILGGGLMFGRMAASMADIRWHLAWVLMVPLATFGLLADGVLSRWDGGALLLGFAAWLALTVGAIRRGRADAPAPPAAAAQRPALLLAMLVAGIAILAAAGHLFADRRSCLVCRKRWSAPPWWPWAPRCRN